MLNKCGSGPGLPAADAHVSREAPKASPTHSFTRSQTTCMPPMASTTRTCVRSDRSWPRRPERDAPGTWSSPSTSPKSTARRSTAPPSRRRARRRRQRSAGSRASSRDVPRCTITRVVVPSVSFFMIGVMHGRLTMVVRGPVRPEKASPRARPRRAPRLDLLPGTLCLPLGGTATGWSTERRRDGSRARPARPSADGGICAP